MSIQLRCSTCGKALSASNKLAGQMVLCPSCRSPISVPRPDAHPTSTMVSDHIGTDSKITQANPKLTSCPDCEDVVSKLAANCPHCGRPMAPESARVHSVPAAETLPIPMASLVEPGATRCEKDYFAELFERSIRNVWVLLVLWIGLGIACAWILSTLLDSDLYASVLFWVFLAIIVVGCWKMFAKAGQPGWGTVVPIYNILLALRIAKLPLWWVFLFFVPFVNIFAVAMVAVRIGRNFGQSDIYIIGLVLVPYIFYPILGLGTAEYAPITR